jgi:hypothetical protein
VFSKYNWCGASTGSHSCVKSVRESDFKQFGIGVVLYFKFLKFMGSMMFIFCILSIPSYVFFYYGNDSSNGDESIKIYLTQLSLGNIGRCKPHSF